MIFKIQKPVERVNVNAEGGGFSWTAPIADVLDLRDALNQAYPPDDRMPFSHVGADVLRAACEWAEEYRKHGQRPGNDELRCDYLTRIKLDQAVRRYQGRA